MPDDYRPIGDLTGPELEAVMQRASRLVESSLPDGALFLVMAYDDTTGPQGSASIGNADRATTIRALRWLADRLERGEKKLADQLKRAEKRGATDDA